jgi:hypothetical protein
VTTVSTVFSVVWPRWRAAFVAVAAAAVLARAAMVAHFLSDVVAGAWLGAVAAFAVYALFVRYGADFQAARRGRFAADSIVPRSIPQKRNQAACASPAKPLHNRCALARSGPLWQATPCDVGPPFNFDREARLCPYPQFRFGFGLPSRRPSSSSWRSISA